MEKSQGDLTDIFRGGGIPAGDDWLSPSFPDDFCGINDSRLHELGSLEFSGLSEKTEASCLSTMIHRTSTFDVRNPGMVEVCSPPTIPSPRTRQIKRRKGQARKVVSIPAMEAAGSRPGGEIVPSDLWAWRKYGQKPIKGSPYPRGYYRCSSSKGCSARKQVERSRTDPNMLVITYTSDHNHPWPTQRNSLAGFTRSQPSKTSRSSSSSKSWNSPSKTSAKEETNNNTLIERQREDDDDLFADLALFDMEKNGGKAMDPFNMLNWDEGNSFDEQ